MFRAGNWQERISDRRCAMARSKKAVKETDCNRIAVRYTFFRDREFLLQAHEGALDGG